MLEMLENIFNRFTSYSWIFYIMLGILLIFIWKNPDISLMIFAAAVFACSLNPFVDKLAKRMSRGAAAAVVLFSVLFLLGILLIPLLLSCVYEIGTFAIEFPNYVSNIQDVIAKYPMLHALGFDKLDWTTMCGSAAEISSAIINDSVHFFQSLSSIFLYIFLTIIFIYYLMADRDSIKKAVLKLFPTKMRNRTNNIIEIIAKRLGGYVVAQSCAITSIGIIMLIGLLIFRIPYAPLLAIITAVLDIIPVIGPAIALVICLIATYEAGLTALMLVIITFCTALLIENNVVRPYAFGKLLNIHPMLIFISLYVSTKYFGIVGTLFAPAIAATICVLIEELYIRNLK